ADPGGDRHRVRRVSAALLRVDHASLRAVEVERPFVPDLQDHVVLPGRMWRRGHDGPGLRALSDLHGAPLARRLGAGRDREVPGNAGVDVRSVLEGERAVTTTPATPARLP